MRQGWCTDLALQMGVDGLVIRDRANLILLSLIGSLLESKISDYAVFVFGHLLNDELKFYLNNETEFDD